MLEPPGTGRFVMVMVYLLCLFVWACQGIAPIEVFPDRRYLRCREVFLHVPITFLLAFVLGQSCFSYKKNVWSSWTWYNAKSLIQNNVFPLFSFTTHGPVWSLDNGFGISPASIKRVLMSLASTIFVGKGASKPNILHPAFWQSHHGKEVTLFCVCRAVMLYTPKSQTCACFSVGSFSYWAILSKRSL